jgi:transposase-like protein
MSHRIYSDEFKAEALELYARVGLNESARQLGVDKKTLLKWARAADVDTQGVALRVSERNRAAAASTSAKVARDRAEARERVVTRLLRTTELALSRELEVLLAGDFTREDLQALTNSRMKAIQQFELLEGRVTTRQDYGLDSILVGVGVAIQRGLEVLPEALRQMTQDAIAAELRVIQTQGVPGLEAGEDDVVEDAEFEEAVDEASPA